MVDTRTHPLPETPPVEPLERPRSNQPEPSTSAGFGYRGDDKEEEESRRTQELVQVVKSPLPEKNNENARNDGEDNESFLKRVLEIESKGDLPPWETIEESCMAVLEGIERSAKCAIRKVRPPEDTKPRRKAQYRRHQQLFQKNPARLARELLDGKGDGACCVPKEEVERTFRGRLEAPGPLEVLKESWPQPPDSNDVYILAPVTASEVKKKRDRLQTSTAAGPDRITKSDLIRFDRSGQKLAVLFNVFLRFARVPTALKKCRSVLIPKCEGAKRLGDFRPITIGSIVLRIFSSVLDGRLRRAVELNPRQRGFINSPGCDENLLLLEAGIKEAKRRPSHAQTTFITLDLAKAFDTVSHAHIKKSLEGRGLEPEFISLVGDMYHEASTTFETVDGPTGPIEIRRGVKQGDPLSSTLFNICIDPLLAALDGRGLGIQVGAGRLSVLGYADDLFVVASGAQEAREALDLCKMFVDDSGLSFNVSKCATFTIRTTCKTWHVVPDMFHMKRLSEKGSMATRIRCLTSIGQVKYLGMGVGAWRGVQNSCDPRTKLTEMLQAVGKGLLKPSQKVFLVGQYVVPRILYGLLAGPTVPSAGFLSEIDGILKRHVKRWLKLPPCATDGLLYASLRDGGIAQHYLSRIVPRAKVRMFERFETHSDPLIVAAAESLNLAVTKARLYRVIESQGGWDYRGAEFVRWTQLGPQGFGVSFYRDSKASHAVLRNPVGRGAPLSERERIALLQMRCNTYPVKEALARARPGTGYESSCRRGGDCRGVKETLWHVLCSCPYTKGGRIARHDRVVDLVARESSLKGWAVQKEPCYTISASGERLKPDLVLRRDEPKEILILDPSIVSEDRIDDTNRLKTRKYQPLVRELETMHIGYQVSAKGLALGVRGIIPLESERTLVYGLGLPKKILTKLSISIARGSINILSHLD